MIETALAIIFSLWTIVPLFFLVLWLIHVESDVWSLIWLLLLGILIFQVFPISATQFWVGAIAYIPIGILWSFHRWKRHCRKAVLKNKKGNIEQWGQGSLTHQLKPTKQADKIVSWIVAWPFSIIDSILGDIWDWLIDLVKIKLVRFYEGIANKAIEQYSDKPVDKGRIEPSL